MQTSQVILLLRHTIQPLCDFSDLDMFSGMIGGAASGLLTAIAAFQFAEQLSAPLDKLALQKSTNDDLDRQR